MQRHNCFYSPVLRFSCLLSVHSFKATHMSGVKSYCKLLALMLHWVFGFIVAATPLACVLFATMLLVKLSLSSVLVHTHTLTDTHTCRWLALIPQLSHLPAVLIETTVGGLGNKSPCVTCQQVVKALSTLVLHHWHVGLVDWLWNEASMRSVRRSSLDLDRLRVYLNTNRLCFYINFLHWKVVLFSL